MTSISKNVYTVKLDEIVNKNNNTYHRIVIMKPVDVKPSMYIDFNKENNKEGSKFKVGDHGRISKYESIFAKAMLQIGLKKFFLLKTLKTLCCGHVIGDLNGEEIVGIIHQKELKKKKKKKKIKKSLELKKLIHGKDNKLYVKWKGFNNSFNSWIDNIA